MPQKILALDDDPVVLRLIKTVLEQEGWEVRTSVNPLTVALTVGNYRPDLVLLDVEMPTIRGTEVLGALRRAACHEDVKICLFSSLDERVLDQLSREYSAAGWIRKASPFDPQMLVARVHDFLGDATPALPKAIVADDSRAMRRLITGVISREGYEVTHAADGPEVLAALDRLGPVALIALDINMPQTDGADLVRRIRSHPGGIGARVLLVTCESDMALVRRVNAGGADAHLIKPFTPEDLRATLRRVRRGTSATG